MSFLFKKISTSCSYGTYDSHPDVSDFGRVMKRSLYPEEEEDADEDDADFYDGDYDQAERIKRSVGGEDRYRGRIGSGKKRSIASIARVGKKRASFMDLPRVG